MSRSWVRLWGDALARRFGWLADQVNTDIPTAVHKRLLALVAQSRKTWLGATPDHSVPGAIGYVWCPSGFVNGRTGTLLLQKLIHTHPTAN